MPERLEVVLLFGGRSVEHLVSVRSARSVMAALGATRHEILPVAVGEDGCWFTADNPLGLRQGEPEGQRHPARILAEPGGVLLLGEGASTRRVTPGLYFPLIHGAGGEVGTLQGLLEVAGAAYAGSGVLASALAMDKAQAKAVLRQAGLPVLDWRVLGAARWRRDPGPVLDGLAAWCAGPVFIKPANGGSSVGVSRALHADERAAALDTAFQYDIKVVVEPALDAREVEVSVLGNEAPVASLPGEIVPAKAFYDYEAKYADDRTRLLVPAPLPPAAVRRAQELAVAAFQAIDAAGFGRVDFLVDRATGAIYISEINTIPGFTEVSMFPRLWEASGVGYTELLEQIIQFGRERRQETAALRRTMI
jgi:D-alanine-D-alanine ligase